MKRIIYDVRPLQTPSNLRGIGTVTRRLLEAMAVLDTENEYLLLRWPGDEPALSLAPGLRWSWLEVKRPWPAKLGWFIDRVRLGPTLKGAADIAHFTSPFDLDLGWPYVGPVPPRRVVTLHDLIPVLHWQETLRSKHRILVPFFMQMAQHLRYAWRLVSVSEHTARLANEVLGIDASHVRVAPIGVDERYRFIDAPARDAFRVRLGLTEPYLLYVGGANPNKNLPRLLEAFGRVPEIPSLVMLTRGAPPTSDGRVRVLRALSDADMPALYGAARLVVMPSRYEGFGLPVLEGMACGTPVVCSDIAPFREVAGDAARMFDPLDVDAMAAAMRGAWTDDVWRREAAASGVTRAATFTWERCARIVLDTYREA